MSSIQEIEAAIERLAPKDFAQLAAWFEERLQSRWDRQLEGDVASGRLDQFYDRLVQEEGEEIPLDDVLDDPKFS
jgi:hypothetical protein